MALGRSYCLRLVAPHRPAQIRRLPLELRAGVAPQEVKPKKQSAHGRQRLVQLLGDETARFLAGQESGQATSSRWWHGKKPCQRWFGLVANQFCSRHSRSETL